MKRKLAVGVVISGFFLYLAIRGIVWSDFLAAFHGTAWGYLVPGVLSTMLGHYTRAWRWRTMMAPVKRIAIGPLWSATAIAFMVNNLFPARVGEFVRAMAIGRTEGVSKSAAFATIVYERVVDVFVLIVLLWFCLLRISGPQWLAKSASLLIVFNVLLLALLVGMVRFRSRFQQLLLWITRPLPARFGDRAQFAAAAFVDGLGVVTNPRAALPIVLYSIAIWGFAVFGFYCALVAAHLSLPPITSLFLIVVISIGSMIPSAPAFLGVMQYACIVGLAVFGVDKATALAVSTMYHATQFFPITAFGFFYAWRSHLRVSDVATGTTH